jgi:hypothetical protein
MGAGTVCFEGSIDFYEKADLRLPVSLASVIMDCPRVRMRHFFFAKSWFRDTLTALPVSMQHRRATLWMRQKPRRSIRRFPIRKNEAPGTAFLIQTKEQG